MSSTIYVIGSEVKKFAPLLKASGYTVISYPATDNALASIDKADLLVIGRDYNDSTKELLKACKRIPKLVVSSNENSKKMGSWLKEPLVFPLHEPSEKELAYFTERLLRESRRRIEARKTTADLSIMKEELAFFEEMHKVLTSSKSLNDVLITIMKRVKEITGAKAWSIILLEQESGELIFQSTTGNIGKKLKNFRLKPNEGIAGWVAKHGEPVVIPDVSKDRRFSPRIDKHSNFKTRSLMCAPITSNEKTIGVLEVINTKNGRPFNNTDLSLLLKILDQSALAIERMSLHEKLEELVITDDLTNLFNLRHLHRSIETEIIRSKRYSTSVSLIFMDLDHFKDINDNYGHILGSKILVEIGQLLISEIRGLDSVARYGGDEFVVILPQTALKNAMRIAERIRRSIEKHTYLKSDRLSLRLTASFGVASFPESAKSKEELIRLADESMYRVKNRTRNNVYAII